MSTPHSTYAVELFLNESSTAMREGRWPRAVAAAERAVRAAEHLDDPALLIRALQAEAYPLRMLGDTAAALARCTRVLALAEDPTTGPRLADRSTAEAVAQAYMDWVNCAQYLTGVAVRDLFGVLDAADRWLTATGHPDWRAGILWQRALIHQRLGELTAAIAAAEEALAAYRPDGPGYSQAAHRFQLGDILRQADRHRDAEPHYQAILDTPTSSPYEQKAAYQGLAYCALNAGDHDTARRHAGTAVSLAEPYGDNALCPALEALVEACRAAGDLDAAWQAATRHLDAATRLGGLRRPYYAVRDTVDVALDRGDLDTARRLLADLDRHAAALDATTATTTCATETARRHRRLTDHDSTVA